MPAVIWDVREKIFIIKLVWSNENSIVEAERKYKTHYANLGIPNAKPPTRKTVGEWIRRLEECGSVQRKKRENPKWE